MDFMHDPSLSLSAVYPGNVFLGAVCIGSSTLFSALGFQDARGLSQQVNSAQLPAKAGRKTI
jgi:hypothetical protein